ncbi:hypothetical protein P4O66_011936 [Electrophorus voltai]|uniref:Uncharacterized protein n=1 Tax=Electrophorus voltai TaxID=2609070 RepID=A0AAD9DUU4_9TELE|nr:hypothetical protein P4O66_011936 [Electrophorus voltai]
MLFEDYSLAFNTTTIPLISGISEQLSVQLDPERPDGPMPCSKDVPYQLLLADPSTAEPLMAVCSALACTPSIPMTAQTDTDPVSALNSQTTQRSWATDRDRAAYGEEISFLWCQENSLSININKTKELILEFRKQDRVHTLITINGATIERANRFLRFHLVPQCSNQRGIYMNRTYQMVIEDACSNDYDSGFAPNKSRSSPHLRLPSYRSPLQVPKTDGKQ